MTRDRRPSNLRRERNKVLRSEIHTSTDAAEVRSFRTI